ncbi:SH2 domain-containing protein 3C isoform X1 [Callorhinchus milii]|uniref:SH2 domain-containing protein 3C isoform X1 n=1 Tax=Callorhinchus milii TaxID=7868 RepID=UPI001C3FE147|nr:SH2 domain-containing protein 3C isoform X1 [Callorhinchus milii]
MSLKKFKFLRFNFGSLTNLPRSLSLRRSSSSATEGRKRGRGREPECLSVHNETMDDLETVPRSPGYARSDEMYTHMGTMPRCNSNRAKKLGKAPPNGQNQGNVRQNPLPPLPSDSGEQPPQPPSQQTAPAQPDTHPRVGSPAQPSSPNPPKHTPTQPVGPPNQDGPGTASDHRGGDEVAAPSDRAEEGSPASRHQEETAMDSNLQNMDSKSEYVKFSKDKYILDSSPEKLRWELEEELKLSSNDVRSHAWYHGHIPREVSENLVQQNGDFLIRDSLTSVGDYVLTSRWRGDPLHFRISKVLLKPSVAYTRVQYLLDNQSFHTVPSLVSFYVGNRKPVSEQSGAIICSPINRTLPLRYLEASYGLSGSKHGPSPSAPAQRGSYIKRRSVTMTDGLTSDKIIKSNGSSNSTPSPHHKEAMRNVALSMDQIKDMHSAMSPVNEVALSPEYSTSLKHNSSLGRPCRAGLSSPVLRRSSEPQLSPSPGSQDPGPCPERPTPSSSSQHCPSPGPSPSLSASQPEGGQYCQLSSLLVAERERHQSYVARLRGEESPGVGGSGLEADTYLPSVPGKEGERLTFSPPVVELTSSFRPSAFHSLLIPWENKPLEMAVLKKVKELLAKEDTKTIAKHITKVDCTVARILGVTKEMRKQMGVGSGLELLTLPHGHQLRLDLIERFNTMAITMTVDILGCTGSTEERAVLLHKTIQLAAELKSNLGNLFGFAAIMKALEMPQITRLEQTWAALRQRHTEGAVLYEKKLKPFLKTLNEGKELSPLTNTTFPHVLPLVTLLERGAATGQRPEPWESSESGVEVVMAHLEAGRTVAHHGGLYRTNANLRLQGFQENEQIMEIFQTEFQMRLLWGCKGASGSQAERYQKFDKVLSALSNKLEPTVRHSEL